MMISSLIPISSKLGFLYSISSGTKRPASTRLTWRSEYLEGGEGGRHGPCEGGGQSGEGRGHLTPDRGGLWVAVEYATECECNGSPCDSVRSPQRDRRGRTYGAGIATEPQNAHRETKMMWDALPYRQAAGDQSGAIQGVSMGRSTNDRQKKARIARAS